MLAESVTIYDTYDKSISITGYEGTFKAALRS